MLAIGTIVTPIDLADVKRPHSRLSNFVVTIQKKDWDAERTHWHSLTAVSIPAFSVLILCLVYYIFDKYQFTTGQPCQI
jgi:hypothetical protein